jgi:hypothetical protein
LCGKGVEQRTQGFCTADGWYDGGYRVQVLSVTFDTARSSNH